MFKIGDHRVLRFVLAMEPVIGPVSINIAFDSPFVCVSVIDSEEICIWSRDSEAIFVQNSKLNWTGGKELPAQPSLS